jgi:hypothetical protein
MNIKDASRVQHLTSERALLQSALNLADDRRQFSARVGQYYFGEAEIRKLQPTFKALISSQISAIEGELRSLAVDL